MSAAPDQVSASVFVEEQHPRSSTGQFGTKSTTKQTAPRQPGRKTPARKAPARKSAKRRVIPKGQLGFDGVSGTGYGMPHGDARVKELQAELNRLGLLDLHGRRLAVDGKLGPLTTSAIRKAQLRLGMKATGIIDPSFIARLRSTKAMPAAKPRTPAKPRTHSGSANSRARVSAKFNPAQPRDPDGKWGDGVGGGIRDLLASLVAVEDGHQDRIFPRVGDGFMDWNERNDDGSYQFEVRGDDGESVYVDLQEDQLKGLHSALTQALGGDDPGLYIAGSSDHQFDWSDETGEDDHLTGAPIRVLNVMGVDGDGNLGASTAIELTEQDMRDWHSGLTITLLRALTAPPGTAPVTASGAEVHVFDNGICTTCEAVTVS